MHGRVCAACLVVFFISLSLALHEQKVTWRLIYAVFLPRTKGQLRGNVSIWWRHRVFFFSSPGGPYRLASRHSRERAGCGSAPHRLRMWRQCQGRGKWPFDLDHRWRQLSWFPLWYLRCTPCMRVHKETTILALEFETKLKLKVCTKPINEDIKTVHFQWLPW